MVRRATILALLGATLCGVLGCAERTGDDLDPPSSSTSSTATTTTATTTTAASPTTLPIDGRIESTRAVDVLTDFSSPSGNIYCIVSPDGVAECAANEQSWAPPPQPADCELDWASRMSVGADGGPADFVCAGDALPAGPDSEALPYGTAIRAGGVVCLSEESGMTCFGEQSRRGFSISRADYRFF